MTATPGHGRGVPWDWTDILLVVPLSFVGLFVLGIVAEGVFRGLEGLVNQDARGALEQFLLTSAFYAATVAAVAGLAVARRGGRGRDLGWRPPSPWWWVPAALPAVLLCLFVAAHLLDLSSHLFPQSASSQCGDFKREYGHAPLLAAAAAAVVAPVSEETLFRGFLYGWLRNRLPVAAAALVSAAIFGAAHIPQGLVLFIPLAAVGFILALMYEASRSLWPGALVHGLFNLVGVIGILTATKC